MPKLWDIFPEALFQDCAEKGLVRQAFHPSKPYAILNYTEKAQYDGEWNACTLACRGLIFNHLTMEVIARPFKKFFNYGDPMVGDIDLDASVIVTDKKDGSLGILYDGDRIATRGSFESDQAIHATDLFRRKYGNFIQLPDWTYLFEIVYPENRIVLDYGDMDDLIFLGAVENASGLSIPPDLKSIQWNGPRTDRFSYRSLREALEAPSRPNAEGIVVHFINTDKRIKIKQDDYVALHKIISGLNERAVWEHLSAGKPLDELLNGLPDEFHVWVQDVADRMRFQVERSSHCIELDYENIIATLNVRFHEGFTQKDFAMVAKEHPRKSELFARHAGKDYRQKLWDDIYPESHQGPRQTT